MTSQTGSGTEMKNPQSICVQSCMSSSDQNAIPDMTLSSAEGQIPSPVTDESACCDEAYHLTLNRFDMAGISSDDGGTGMLKDFTLADNCKQHGAEKGAKVTKRAECRNTTSTSYSSNTTDSAGDNGLSDDEGQTDTGTKAGEVQDPAKELKDPSSGKQLYSQILPSESGGDGRAQDTHEVPVHSDGVANKKEIVNVVPHTWQQHNQSAGDGQVTGSLPGCSWEQTQTLHTLDSKTGETVLVDPLCRNQENANISVNCNAQGTKEAFEMRGAANGSLDSESNAISEKTSKRPPTDNAEPSQDVSKTQAASSSSPASLEQVLRIENADGEPSNASNNAGSKAQAPGEKDVVHITRRELTLMVEQTLAAQTMHNYVQELVQKNKTLNKQNEVLKETVQSKAWQYIAETNSQTRSLPVCEQATEGEVFRFPASLPAKLTQPSISSEDKTSTQDAHHQMQEQEPMNSPPQADGDSSSIFFSSIVDLDGDPTHGTKDSREASAAGVIPASSAAGNTGAASSLFVTNQLPANIPVSTLFAGASCYSLGPQQLQQQQPQVVMGSAGISPEQYEQAVSELEKLKGFIHKLINGAGIPLDGFKELLYLRETVQKLTKENGGLKTELQNRPSTGSGNRWNQEKLREYEKKFRQQEKREHELLSLLSNLKPSGRPTSQPSSAVGWPALSAIPPCNRINVESQTDHSYVNRQDCGVQTSQDEYHQLKLNQLALIQQLSASKQQLVQAQEKELDYRMQLDKMRDELMARNHQNTQLSLQVQCLCQKLEHQKELIDQVTNLLHQNDVSKKRLSEEVERNKRMEKMLEDERKRFHRDEKELLDRVKLLTEDRKTMKGLILAIDLARQEGTALSPNIEQQVTAMRRKFTGNAKAPPNSRPPQTGSSSTATASSKVPSLASSSRMPAMTPDSGVRQFPVSVGSSENSTVTTGRQQRSQGAGAGSQAAYVCLPPSVAPHASLPPEMSRQYLLLYPGQPFVHPQEKRHLQKSNVKCSDPSLF